MPQRVIDLLETIQIDVHQRNAETVVRLTGAIRQHRIQVTAVGQPRQRIVHGQVFQIGPGRLQLRIAGLHHLVDLGECLVGTVHLLFGAGQFFQRVFMALNFLEQLRLAVHHVGVVHRHEKRIGRGQQGGHHPGHQQIPGGHMADRGMFENHVRRKKNTQTDNHLRKHGNPGRFGRIEVEEGQDGQQHVPHQKGRAGTSEIKTAPQHREIEVGDRQVGPQRELTRKAFEQWHKHPEPRDGSGQHGHMREGMRIDEVHRRRHLQAQQRAKQVTEQKHPHPLAGVHVSAQVRWHEPFNQCFDLFLQTHGHLSSLPAQGGWGLSQGLRTDSAGWPARP